MIYIHIISDEKRSRIENATDTDDSCGATGGWRREEGAEGERRVRTAGRA